jgi:hypothetical protein
MWLQLCAWPDPSAGPCDQAWSFNFGPGWRLDLITRGDNCPTCAAFGCSCAPTKECTRPARKAPGRGVLHHLYAQKQSANCFQGAFGCVLLLPDRTCGCAVRAGRRGAVGGQPCPLTEPLRWPTSIVAHGGLCLPSASTTRAAWCAHSSRKTAWSRSASASTPPLAAGPLQGALKLDFGRATRLGAGAGLRTSRASGRHQPFVQALNSLRLVGLAQ